MTTTIDDYLTVSEAAELIGVTEGRVRQMRLAGMFPGAKQKGRPWYLPKDEVEAVAKEERKPGPRASDN